MDEEGAKKSDPALTLAVLHRLCEDGTARRIRNANRLSLRVIAEATGNDPVTIYRWEKAERLPRMGKGALAYAALLGGLLELDR